MIRFEIIFACGVRTVSNLIFFFFRVCEFVPEPFVEKTILSSLNCLGTFVKNPLTVNVGFTAGLSILPHQPLRRLLGQSRN